jgi:hypothetical protein
MSMSMKEPSEAVQQPRFECLEVLFCIECAHFHHWAIAHQATTETRLNRRTFHWAAPHSLQVQWEGDQTFGR